MTKGITLAALSAISASETPFEFDYLLPDGSKSGVRLQVLGSQSAKVQAEINRLINERRTQESAKAYATQRSGGAEAITPIEDDIAFGHRLSAVRLVGWVGVEEPYSEAGALMLCQSNADISDQVLKASNNLGNFMRLKPKA